MLTGSNTIQFHFASEQGAQLSIHSDEDASKYLKVSLEDLIKTRCSSLFASFGPPWWLSNGHSQTLYTVIGDFTNLDVVNYSRQFLRTTDGGTLGLDFTPVEFFTSADDSPIVVVAHGMTGSSQDPAVRAVLKRVCDPVADGGLGYRAVVVNNRGCGGVPVTSPRLYSAGHTDDLRLALIYLQHKYPHAPLLGLGFSLGANLMTRYVAEEGEASRLSSVCCLSSPWSFFQNSHQLKRSFIGKNLYARGMGASVMSLLKRHAKALRQYPDHPICQALVSTLQLVLPTIIQVDDVFCRLIAGEGPIFPFPTVDEYYQWASSDHVVDKIRVPLLSINAADDPLVSWVPMDAKGNPLVIMALTKGGGHLGWFESRERRWTTKPILEWLKLTGETIVHGETTRRSKTYVDPEGYFREDGTTSGCKEVEGDASFADKKDRHGGLNLRIFGAHLSPCLTRIIGQLGASLELLKATVRPKNEGPGSLFLKVHQ